MSALERVFVGLYGGAWLALHLVIASCFIEGRTLPLLDSKGGYGVPLYLILWIVIGLLLQIVPSADRAWRVILAATAFALGLNAVLGLWRVAPTAPAMAAAMGALGLLLVLLTPLLDARRIHKRRPKRRKPAVESPSRRPRLHLAWWAWTLAVCISFGLAYTGDARWRGAAQGIWLIVLFLATPAIAVGAWQPRVAAGALTFTALACGLFYAPHWALIAPPVALLIAALGFVWPMRPSSSAV